MFLIYVDFEKLQDKPDCCLVKHELEGLYLGHYLKLLLIGAAQIRLDYEFYLIVKMLLIWSQLQKLPDHGPLSTDSFLQNQSLHGQAVPFDHWILTHALLWRS
jgi:hypothetical protein